MLAITIFLLTGCTNESNTPVPDTMYDNISINTTLTNEDSRDDKYYLFFIIPNTLTDSAETNKNLDYVGPIESDENLKFNVDLKFNWDLFTLLKKTNDNQLQLIVTTVEDIFMLNPLNDKNETIKFYVNNDSNTKNDFEYYSKINSKDISITDRFKDNVYSLHFQDAKFVIKLKFTNGYDQNGHSYEVGITNNNTDGLNYVSSNTSPSLYYEVPFYEKDNLSNWKGTIKVTDLTTNEETIYQEYPKSISFNSNGNCNEGNIVDIIIEN